MIELKFSLPWGPSVNRYYRSLNKGPLAGRVLISEEGRAYRKQVAFALLVAGMHRHRLDGSLEIDILVYPPNRMRRDLDNMLKPLLDALTHGGTILDDACFDRLSIERREVVPGGAVEVVIRQRRTAAMQQELAGAG
jgi:crossover junction endodeoxyribonuclease RusA